MNERKQGKYRNILLEGKPYPDGKGCNCGPFKEEIKFKAAKEGENRKDWEPTLHTQLCRICDREYHLEWAVTEMTYL
jgi:hypothetical protein